MNRLDSWRGAHSGRLRTLADFGSIPATFMADFQLDFEGPDGRRRRLTLPAEPRQAAAVRAFVEKAMSHHVAGYPLPQAMLDEAARFPRRIRNRLREWGLLGGEVQE